VASYADKISEFNKRIADIAAKLTSLGDRRKSYSLAAASGDARALKQVGEVDWELDALRKEQQTVASAIETAQALEKQHELDAEAELQRAREGAAYQAARAIASLNLELDQELVRLRGAFERRAILLKALGETGAVDAALVMRLHHKSLATSAAQLVGLSRFLNLEMTPTASQRPLASSNEMLLRIGSEPPSDGNGKGNNGKPMLRPLTRRAAP
jgi:hypothetical protein